jgi:hypothetical protein
LGFAAEDIHAHPASAYERHRPEETVLYQLVEEHWPRFRERAGAVGSLPKFVVREFEEYMRCGRLEYGCLRCACTVCGLERLVAFSCKRRAFCPSCLGRRMNDTAVHLVERVLPKVRIRQWVCALPWALRVRLGYDRELCSEVLGIFVGEVSRSLRRRARERWGVSPSEAKTGAVTFVQRFDSALRLNVHFHSLVLDGVYVQGEAGALEFRELPAPTPDDVLEVARRTAERVTELLERRSGDASLLEKEPVLAPLSVAAAQGTLLFGEHAGQKAPRIVDPSAARPSESAADAGGFNVHAGVAVDGRDRVRLERVCRYLARPPIAQERLTRLSDGRVKYTMKKAWRDGTRAVVLEPLELVARLCAMVPPPGFHMTRFHGVFAAHAKDRAHVVPEREAPAEPTAQLPLFPSDEPEPAPARKPWAWLLRHVFAVDVTVCPACSGRMRWLAVATTPEAIARALADHGLRARAPPRRRAPFGQLELRFV